MSKETVISALAKRADQVRSASEILVAKTRDWQTIKQYLSGRLDDGLGLTEEQQAKLDRYQFIYNQLASGKYTEQEVLQMVVKIYKVGLPQAYEDKNATQEIFSSVLSINKRFEQKMELESAKDLKRKCVELGDMKAAAAFQKNIIALQKELQEPEDENAADLWEGIHVESAFDPELLGAPDVDFKQVISVINEKRKNPIDMNLFAEDIDHEEVPDENR